MSLGIDFGTRWSSAAVAIGGKPRPIKDPERLQYSIPSVVCWESGSNKLLVGEAAEVAGREHPDRVARELKRDVGKGNRYYLGAGVPHTHEELVAALFRQFISEATAIHPDRPAPTAAVVTVPALWAGHSRSCIVDAARSAGFTPHLLSEPVAAALDLEHQTKTALAEGESLLVYQLGAGAFEASLLTKRNGQFRMEIHSRGSDEIGGAEFDRLIFKDLFRNCPTDLRERLDARTEAGLRLRLALADRCRALKHQLSRSTQGCMRPDPEGSDWVYTLDSNRFENLIRPQLDATVVLCKNLLTETGFQNGQAPRILLTGGSTRIPLVGKLIEQAFNRKPEPADDPELAICRGAALHAARVCPSSTLDDPDLAAAMEAVEAERRNQVERAGETPFVFLMAGRTGVGKSSTVNSLLSRQVAAVGDHEPTTAEVVSHRVQMGRVPFDVVDTVGLCDGKLPRERERDYLRLIVEKAPKVHSLWFVSQLDETRVSRDEIRAIGLITEAFGFAVWQHAVIVLTRADYSISPEDYARDLAVRGNLIRDAIAAHTGAAIASEIPAVAVDNTSTTTPDGRPWKGLLYAAVFRRVAAGGLVPFAVGTEFQVRVVESAPTGTGRQRRRVSAFNVLQATSGNLEYDYEDELSPRGEDVNLALIELDPATARELQQRTRSSIVEVCTHNGGSVGESVGRILGVSRSGRTAGEVVGKSVGKLLAWFGW